MSKGRLISFEGLDGAGKTTQMQLLEQWLISRNLPYLRTREPGGTPLGVEIRHLLLNRPDLAITPLAEAFLFQADRAQHFTNVILPTLAAGKLVITDRCFDASIAYQGHA
ncbi:MAG: dTMP kinase, partial [Chloroflexota bacterium]|nr:dTMP kinase [Chloroflexota bacterium]